mmetsp:Transcript_119608/g.333770  ORF Transcript_119608/g.333770 Transcript_119608/m.333770 type:complete len:265 (-) Transcript_119608:286-1080(-)
MPPRCEATETASCTTALPGAASSPICTHKASTCAGLRYITMPSRSQQEGKVGTKPAASRASTNAGAGLRRSKGTGFRALQSSGRPRSRGSLTSKIAEESTSKSVICWRPRRYARASMPAPRSTACRTPRSQKCSSRNRSPITVRGVSIHDMPPPYCRPCAVASLCARGSKNMASGLSDSTARAAAEARAVTACLSVTSCARTAGGDPNSSSRASTSYLSRCCAFSMASSPSPFVARGFAPASNSARATAACPFQAARCNAVGAK